MMHLSSAGGLSEYQVLRARFGIVEREEIVRQREAIVYLEQRVEELMRIRNRVQRALNGSEQETRRILVEVLEGWPCP